jgi:hypothetical protein
MPVMTWLEQLRRAWNYEETLHMRKIAEGYAQRAQMNGDVIKKTGEIISRESA